MSLQNSYTNSIGPKSLSQLRQIPNFVEFMSYFERDCEEFIRSCIQLDDFVAHFSLIGKEMDSKSLLTNFLSRVNFHSTLADYKISPVKKYLDFL